MYAIGPLSDVNCELKVSDATDVLKYRAAMDQRAQRQVSPAGAYGKSHSFVVNRLVDKDPS